MRVLTRYILKEHLMPFVYALIVLIFLLFTNFLLRAVDRFIGKGLPVSVILEYLALNTAWIVALATPMAVLVATLMAFGRLSADNEIMALRGSGVSLSRILLPALGFGTTVCGILIYFNNAVLPEMNHKARLLGRDIYRKRPDLNVEAGYFIDDLPDYSFIVRGKRGNRYQDVRIFGKDRVKTQTSIHAAEGTFTTIGEVILITLYDGEIHELDVKNFANYRRIAFEKHRIAVSADDLVLQRRETTSRSDREMTLNMMKEKIKGYEKRTSDARKRMTALMENKMPGVSLPMNFHEAIELIDNQMKMYGADTTMRKDTMLINQRTLNTLSRRLRADYQLLEGYQRSINRYRVEIHKKFSIPVACIAFILVGTPLGVMIRRGAALLSLGFFVIYWIFLIAGEELADRNLLSPVLAMWTPNAVLSVVGIYLSFRSSRERTVLRLPLLDKLLKRKTEE
ncbi:MAG: LptF/LptG family permease [Candidatus Neomarinimicrobiota bacterium]